MTRPILAGFHPDPSICRVGDTYYIATSSFEYSPGVPIHRSRDLLEWELLGNALDRPTQLRPSPGAKDSGVYAPTLRHHDGRFWLITTDTSRPFDGQLIVHAERAEGPWSDPVFVPAAIGIDPDLAWDDDGSARLTWKSFHPELFGVASAPLDLDTGRLLTEPVLLWGGTGLPHGEAPHLYRIGAWWYLLIAEGGTERGHVVSIARSRRMDGPYEGYAGNPILSHRSTDHAVQNTGHGDLVELEDGTWAMVYLGVRPRGITPGFHVNGRETFVAGIDWLDEWPVVREDRFAVAPQDHSFVDDFSRRSLHPRWIAPGAAPGGFAELDSGGLILRPESARLSRALLCTRALDVEWTVEVDLDAVGGGVRLVVRLDDDHWYAVTIAGGHAEVELHAGPVVGRPVRVPVDTTVPLTVGAFTRMRPPPEPWGAHPEPDLVGFFVRVGDGAAVPLGEYDGRYLSTEVAGGFTGRVWGLEPLAGEIVVRAARYTTVS